jgi:hypothetical protein
MSMSSGCSTFNELTGDITTEQAEFGLLKSSEKSLREQGCPGRTYNCSVTKVSLSQETPKKFVGFVEMETTGEIRHTEYIEIIELKGTYPVTLLTKDADKFIVLIDGSTDWKRKRRKSR